VTDLNSYKRLAATIPSAELNAKRKRLRAGDVATVGTIWRKRMRESSSFARVFAELNRMAGMR
jgi:hypothetical protein